jgi:hypothetical protein
MKRLAIAIALLGAMFAAAPAAQAQSVGIGVHIGGRHGGVSIGVYENYGYRHYPRPYPDCGYRGCYPPAPVYRYPDCGPRCYDRGGYYPPAPVYRDGCHRGCGDDGYYSHPSFQITVPENAWDPECYGRGYRTVWVYWDARYQGYFWTNRYGDRIPY